MTKTKVCALEVKLHASRNKAGEAKREADAETAKMALTHAAAVKAVEAKVSRLEEGKRFGGLAHRVRWAWTSFAPTHEMQAFIDGDMDASRSKTQFTSRSVQYLGRKLCCATFMFARTAVSGAPCCSLDGGFFTNTHTTVANLT